jgi:hypothetical protein
MYIATHTQTRDQHKTRPTPFLLHFASYTLVSLTHHAWNKGYRYGYGHGYDGTVR